MSKSCTACTFTSPQNYADDLAPNKAKLALGVLYSANVIRLVTRDAPKRPADDADVATAIQAAGIKDDDRIQKVLEVDKKQLTLIVSLVVNKSNYRQQKFKLEEVSNYLF